MALYVSTLSHRLRSQDLEQRTTVRKTFVHAKIVLVIIVSPPLVLNISNVAELILNNLKVVLWNYPLQGIIVLGTFLQEPFSICQQYISGY